MMIYFIDTHFAEASLSNKTYNFKIVESNFRL